MVRRAPGPPARASERARDLPRGDGKARAIGPGGDELGSAVVSERQFSRRTILKASEIGYAGFDWDTEPEALENNFRV